MWVKIYYTPLCIELLLILLISSQLVLLFCLITSSCSNSTLSSSSPNLLIAFLHLIPPLPFPPPLLPLAPLIFYSNSIPSSPPSVHPGAVPPVGVWVLQLPSGPRHPRPLPQPAVWERRERAGRPACHTQLRVHQLSRWGVMNEAGWICLYICHVRVWAQHLNLCKNIGTWLVFTYRVPADRRVNTNVCVFKSGGFRGLDKAIQLFLI